MVASGVLQPTTTPIDHHGLLIDIRTGSAIKGEAVAYSESQPLEGDCSSEKDQLDRTDTDATTGSFTFQIPLRPESEYHAKYCAENYRPRPIAHNSNAVGISVLRNPVKLLPVGAAEDQENAYYQTVMETLLADVASDLGYLERLGGENFDNVIAFGGLLESESELVSDFLAMHQATDDIPDLSTAQTEPAGEELLYDAVIRVLDDASSIVQCLVDTEPTVAASPDEKKAVVFGQLEENLAQLAASLYARPLKPL